MKQVLSNHGAGGRDRTGDLLITRESQTPDGALTCGKHNTADQSEAHTSACDSAEPGKDTGKDEAERIRAAVAGQYPCDRIETGPLSVVQELCPCGEPSAGWPGDEGRELCQLCWEKHCADTWWATVAPALASVASVRYGGVILTGGVVAGQHGTETQTPHDQASFADPVAAATWIQGRCNATGRKGALVVYRTEFLRAFKPETKP